ncbi:MAG: phosphotransferase [Candidatus Gracilibacteria bacterium]|nr:phosphotransferase [Candidatus Gracilibacteria bacterium]
MISFANKLSYEWDNLNEIGYKKGLLHNDLYSRNIFICSDFEGISGIIDFSDMTFGDVNIDFMFMYFENPEFAMEIILRYQLLSGEKLDIPKIRLYAKTFALNEYFWEDISNKGIAEKWISGEYDK